MKNMGDRNFELRCTCRSVEWLLKDYFRKLETDDYDSSAVEKMKDIKTTLKEITEIEIASNEGKLTWND